MNQRQKKHRFVRRYSALTIYQRNSHRWAKDGLYWPPSDWKNTELMFGRIESVRFIAPPNMEFGAFNHCRFIYSD